MEVEAVELKIGHVLDNSAIVIAFKNNIVLALRYHQQEYVTWQYSMNEFGGVDCCNGDYFRKEDFKDAVNNFENRSGD